MEEQPALIPEKIQAASDLTEEQWHIAVSRYNIIEPLINNVPGITATEIAGYAGVTRMTLYRWMQKYKRTETVSSLADDENRRSTDTVRLLPEVDNILNRIIQEKYLKKQKLNITKTVLEVELACRAAGLTAPAYLTIRQRISKISEAEKVARRYSSSTAKKFDPLNGSFPDADYPLQAVQVDHTPLDLIVVDDIYRRPIGKPWITVAIDVYSRMVIGFYISLDPPGSLGTGLCLSHAIQQKETWLCAMNVKGEWPCYGIMQALYIDNAKEFHGKSLERACSEYGININFRPVATPNYGGHIERLLGTMLREIHTLPGTTFSNTKDRKYYDSEGRACFTLKELEKWMATFIVDVYHQSYHSTLQTTPLAKYREGIDGTDTQPGIGRRPIVNNADKLRLDFIPLVERSIQRYGVSIDGIWYYQDVLKKWVFSYENRFAKNKVHRKFTFKRDPRDISAVYFYDPDIKDYYMIPYRNITYPAITIWEHKRIVRDLRQKGLKHVDESLIFDAYERMKDMEANATGNTAAAKRLRNSTRKRYASESSVKNSFVREEPAVHVPPSIDFNKQYLPFEDIEG